MRMLLKCTIPVRAGNDAIADGSLPTVVQQTMQELRPECAYFYPDHGKRTSMMVFDLKDASQLPGILEPIFTKLDAEIEIVPVMNADELGKGLEAAKKKLGR